MAENDAKTEVDQKSAVAEQSAERVSKTPKKKRTFKIIVIGDSGVGKTCLTYRFCSGKFPSTPTDATIGVDFREKMITIDNNEQVNIPILSFFTRFLHEKSGFERETFFKSPA